MAATIVLSYFRPLPTLSQSIHLRIERQII